MSKFRDSIKVEINPNAAVENQKKEHFRELLGFYLGSILHEDWNSEVLAKVVHCTDGDVEI